MKDCNVADCEDWSRHCADCGHADRKHTMLLISANLGEGAFLAVLCDVCWHRRQYRADLRRRLYGDALSQVPGVF